MKIYFSGSSFAASHLRNAAKTKGLDIIDQAYDAELIFVSEDTITDKEGNRQLHWIKNTIHSLPTFVPLVITSQVPPGFTRSLGRSDVIHQAETLRISDAVDRALHPEQIICGKHVSYAPSAAYMQYLEAFNCPVHWMSWEEAEMSKIAINMALAAQVDFANRMNEACNKVSADWNVVKQTLHLDKRIGHHAYLTPGRWQDSLHLLRDSVTLKEIEDA